MYYSISNEVKNIDGIETIFYRVSFTDGRTILFSDIDECFNYVNDTKYNYRKAK